MKQCKPLWIVSILLLCLSLTACQGSNLGEPPVPMERVTVDTDQGYVTMEFDLPEGWCHGMKDGFSAGGVNIEALGISPTDTREPDYESVPYQLFIEGYNPGGNEHVKERYQLLFRGDYEAFENDIEENRELFGLSPDGDTKREYQQYRGKNGKIAVIYATYPYAEDDRLVREIQCYREDIPYVVRGAFDDSEEEISSGEIALWVASTLEVTEHFTFDEEGYIQLVE